MCLGAPNFRLPHLDHLIHICSFCMLPSMATSQNLSGDLPLPSLPSLPSVPPSARTSQASCKATRGTLCHRLGREAVGSTGRAPAGPQPDREGGQPTPGGRRAQAGCFPQACGDKADPRGSKHLVRVPRRPGRKWDQLIHICLSRLEYEWGDGRINLFKNVIS